MSATAAVRAARDTAPDPLDVRLAAGAVAAWLAVFLAVDAGSATGVVVGGVAAAVVGAGLLAVGPRIVHERAAAVVRVLALSGFCVALVLLPLAGRIGHARASPVQQLAQRHGAVTVEVTVTADPRLLAAKGPAGAARVAVETSVDSLRTAGSSVAADGDLLVLGDAQPWRDVLPGQRVRLDGTVQPDLDGGVLSATLFERGPPQLAGTPPWWQRLAGRVRASLRQSARVLPDQERGLLPGLVDGDTANLDPVLAEHFRAAGLTHLVAVSGTNCSIVIGAVLLVLRRCRVRPWACALVGALVLVTFVIVARPSPSVLRAAVMASIALISLASGRPRAALPSLAAVVLALLLWDPTLAGSASFAMSVLATAGLLVLAPGWARALRARGVPVGLAESFAVASAAHLVTAPVVAALSGRISVVAIPANILAEPVVAVTTVLGFLAAVTSPCLLGAGEVFAWAAGWPCRWLVRVADFFGSLDGATLPWLGGTIGALTLVGVIVVLGLLAIRAGLRHALAAALVTGVVVLLPVRAATTGWPPDGWIFVACDVGQGDGLVLNAGDHAGVLVDAGPDPVAIDRCLDDLGVTSLPLIVITHLHLDHVGGLSGAVRQRPVGQVLTGPLPDPIGGLHLALDATRPLHRTLRTPAVGTHLQVGAVTLDVLGPAAAFHGTRSDPNNSSLVLRATVGGTRILLPGDAEVEAQHALVTSGADLRADVLKVPHHGSAYSDPEFLAAAHSRVAVVSVGLHNELCSRKGPTMPNMRAAVYVRISADPDGTGLGVERQEADCRALCQREGYEVGQVFRDNDVSASRASTKPRPQYEEMLERCRRGEFGVIVAYDTARLTRRLKEFIGLIDLYDEHGVIIKTASSQSDDLSDDNGRLVAQIKASVDEAEAARTSRRARRAKQAKKAKGLYAGGARRFGFGEPLWIEDANGKRILSAKNTELVNEAEAAAIKLAAQLVLDGHGVREVIRQWNAQGVRGVRGGNWDRGRVKAILSDAGNVPLILDEDTHGRVTALLSEQSKKYTRGSEPMHFLAGVAECGVCNRKLKSTQKHGKAAYACPDFHQNIQASIVEGAVSARVARWYASGEKLPSEPYEGRTIGDVQRARAALITERDELQDDVNAGVATYKGIRPRLLEIRTQLDALDRELNDLRQTDANQALIEAAVGKAEGLLIADVAPVAVKGAKKLSGRSITGGHLVPGEAGTTVAMPGLRAITAVDLTGGSVRARWDAMPVQSKKDLLGAKFRVVIHPAAEAGYGAKRVKVYRGDVELS